MRERLRKIAEGLALRPGLLCVKPQMVGITQHAFEEEHGLIQLFRAGLTGACQRLHEPEGAHVESALLARKPIDTRVRRVAVHETVTDETTLAGALENGIYCAEHAGIVGSHEKNQRHNQKRRIQVLAPIELSERAPLLIPAARHHFLIDAIPLQDPLRT